MMLYVINEIDRNTLLINDVKKSCVSVSHYMNAKGDIVLNILEERKDEPNFIHTLFLIDNEHNRKKLDSLTKYVANIFSEAELDTEFTPYQAHPFRFNLSTQEENPGEPV